MLFLRSTLILVLCAISGCVYSRNAVGYISLSWELQKNDGSSAPCFDGETVSITAGASQFTYACSQLEATTAPIAIGTYSVAFTFSPVDGGAPVTITRTVDVFRNATTDVGHLIFTVSAPAPQNGSATFSWNVFQAGSNVAENCIRGESIVFQVGALAAFTTDCYQYDTQPVTDMAPGAYTATLTLQNATTTKDVVTTNFQVVAGADTPVHVDFVVPAGTRDVAPDRSQGGGGPAPSISYH